MAKLRTENERLRTKLAQAEAIIGVQGEVHALLEEISKSGLPPSAPTAARTAGASPPITVGPERTRGR